MTPRQRLNSGAALLEVIVTSAVSTAMLAALMAAAVGLQRGYTAISHQVTTQEDQMRAIDFITRDLQRASTVKWSNTGRMLTVTVPEQNKPVVLPLNDLGLTAVPLKPPTLVDGVISYGGTPISISYYIEGRDFVRLEGTVRTSISSTIEEFIGSTSGSMATFQLAFTPKFSKGDPAVARAATRITTAVFLRNVNRTR